MMRLFASAVEEFVPPLATGRTPETSEARLIVEAESKLPEASFLTMPTVLNFVIAIFPVPVKLSPKVPRPIVVAPSRGPPSVIASPVRVRPLENVSGDSKPVALIVMLPGPGVIAIFVPAVRVAAVGAAPSEPISSWPFANAADSAIAPPEETMMRLFASAVEEFVPPLATGRTPETSEARLIVEAESKLPEASFLTMPAVLNFVIAIFPVPVKLSPKVPRPIVVAPSSGPPNAIAFPVRVRPLENVSGDSKPVALIVMLPGPGAIEIFVPAKREAATGAAPSEPISSWPFASADASTIAPPEETIRRLFASAVEEFVPPLATGRTPETSEARLIVEDESKLPEASFLTMPAVLNFEIAIFPVPVKLSPKVPRPIVVAPSSGPPSAIALPVRVNPLENVSGDSKPIALIVMLPGPGVIEIFVPAVSPAATGAAPMEPISSWPFASADDSTIAPPEETMMRLFASAVEEFVPPLATGRTPETSAVAKSTAFVAEPLPLKTDDSTMPDPESRIDAPVPTVIVAAVLAPVVIEEKGIPDCEERIGTQTGAAEVPALYSKRLFVVLKIRSPLAGLGIPARSPSVIRGARKPMLLAESSRIADWSGVAMPTPMFCTCE